MKRKPGAQDSEPIVDRQLLDRAKIAALGETTPKGRCMICEAETAPISTENLCWVCRRLKISAWRDSDQQISAQE